MGYWPSHPTTLSSHSERKAASSGRSLRVSRRRLAVFRLTVVVFPLMANGLGIPRDVLPLRAHRLNVARTAEFGAPGGPRKTRRDRRRFTFGTGLNRCPEAINARSGLGEDVFV